MKRTFDIFVSLALLAIFFMPIVLLGCAVWFRLGRPIFFIQTRPGLHGKLFKIIKFRTMSNLVTNTGDLCPDDLRLETFGAFLRKTSLDELPELWNVLVGDMSLVGPRPLLVEYLSLYSSEQTRRHDVRPGVTGWAQVNGRNAISWEDKFRFDLWYVDHQNMMLDFIILLLTVKKVLIRDGINSVGNVTMPKFYGTKAKEFKQ